MGSQLFALPAIEYLGVVSALLDTNACVDVDLLDTKDSLTTLTHCHRFCSVKSTGPITDVLIAAGGDPSGAPRYDFLDTFLWAIRRCNVLVGTHLLVQISYAFR